ncbi:MAG: GGDEF domain-containing protein [Nitrospiraceae bacterium]|nr:GGDEF domain-containing protein [Nitrospiraceae bacterium]
MGEISLFERFKSSSPCRIVLLSIVLSESLAVLINAAAGIIGKGRVDGSLLLVGAIDALAVSAVMAVLGVRFILKERGLVEEALMRQSRDIFDSIRDPFSVFSADFRITRTNGEYAALKNRTVEELTGERRCYEIAGRTGVCEDCVVQKTMLTANPCAKEKRMGLSDGSDIWVEIYTYPMPDSDGRVSHVIEYIRDITARKAAEAERRTLIEELQRLSRSDDLTGLLNKRALMERLGYEQERARRYKTPLCLIICDLDNFKQVNDTLGHEAGDRVLRIVARTLAGTLRKSDIIGRQGGDEFMLVLPQTPLEGAVEFAERLRRNVEDIDYPADITTRPTLSLGIAAYPDAPGANDILRRADTALYDAKKAGKNRVSATL